MKLLQHVNTGDNGGLFLYGAIMFANIDYVGVMDYVIKAVLGGAVWFGFKLLQEYYSLRIKGHAKGHDEHKDDHKQ
jgi:hypothetical protein